MMRYLLILLTLSGCATINHVDYQPSDTTKPLPICVWNGNCKPWVAYKVTKGEL